MKTRPLSEFVDEIQTGFACGETQADGIVQLRMNNVDTEGSIDFSTVRRVPRNATKNIDRFMLSHGDVMFNNTNSPELVGKSAVFPGFPEPVVFSNHFTRVRVKKDRLEPRFLARWLGAQWRAGRFARMCNQWVNQASVRTDALLQLEVPDIDLPEQQRIANILDKADAIRRKRKEAIALTDDLLRSTFLEMFGDPVTNPKAWPTKKLGCLLTMPLRNGLSPASNGRYRRQVLTLASITGRAFDPTKRKDAAFAVEPPNQVEVDEADFLICRGNGNKALVGRGEYPSRIEGRVVFPDTMIAARIDHEQIGPASFATLWNSEGVRRQIEASARTTNGTFKINQRALESVVLTCPPRETWEPFEIVATRLRAKANRDADALAEADGLLASLSASFFSAAVPEASLP